MLKQIIEDNLKDFDDKFFYLEGAIQDGVSNKKIVKSFLLQSQIRLLKGVVEEIRVKRKEIWVFYHEAQLWKEQQEAVKPIDDILHSLQDQISKIEETINKLK